MPPRKKTTSTSKQVETLKHGAETRKNIPTAEYESVVPDEQKTPIQVAYERRNRDLDPQLVWRGKDEQDWSDLVVNAPLLYIQEKIHPKVLIDDLLNQSQARQDSQLDLFADFNGLPDNVRGAEFYQHDAHWTNRMILGDSLQVMASLAEREGLKGKVQCIYLDPPYGIKFNSNFQWSTTSRDVKDGKADHITREPEQVKAFRDTWRDGIHSYLTYLRDRLTVARDLLTDSGSIFVQIGDENVHRVRAVMDETFGNENFICLIAFTKGATGLSASGRLTTRLDYLIQYSKNSEKNKYKDLFILRSSSVDPSFNWVLHENGCRERLTKEQRLGGEEIPAGARVFQDVSLTKPGPGRKFTISFNGSNFDSGKRWWGMPYESLARVLKTGRVDQFGNALRQLRFQDESSAVALGNLWDGFLGQNDPVYVVQTNTEIVQRCILMTTDPGDLVLDPTCGSGTTAYVAEQWGRRWITIDTSRVALALARARIMGAKYPYYLLKDSPAGQQKEAEITQTIPSKAPTYGNIRQGFVYERVPHVTLKSIANNTDIDTIYEEWQPHVTDALAAVNKALQGHKTPFKVTTGGRDGKTINFTATGTVKLPSGEDAPANALLEWEVPREAPADWPTTTHQPLADYWQARIDRQKEIDESIAAKAEQEFLYDKPYEERNTVRVAGPFTVESLSPHRVLIVNHDDELIDPTQSNPEPSVNQADFADVILENLKVAGVQQAHKENKINFSSLTVWPGKRICAEGRYLEGESQTEKRAGIFIGPEYGTVSRPDLVSAAREAGDAGFDVLISCAFNYDAHSAEFDKLGRVPVLKARMNADLHMANDLKKTNAGNLFVIFGEPDIDIMETDDNQIQVKIHGIDIFYPQSGEVKSSSSDDIACWFIDTDYNEESFFVRHAYFMGANDPYKFLKSTLRAEIDEAAWASLVSDTSRPFYKPKSGRIAVKVINHLGDEVMKVFNIE